MPVRRSRRWTGWWQAGLALAVVAALLSLGAANILLRASWNEVEDGVLWVARAEGVVAAEVLPSGPGAAAGLRAGDLLLAIDGAPVDGADDVVSHLHAGDVGTTLTYTVLRLGTREMRQVALQPVPGGNRALYFVLAAVAIFTLLVGLSVRLRRPGDQATLHFFWLCVALFGVFAFSYSGRLDRLDWFFYWADVVSLLLLPPLFVHFALVFPDRPGAWVRTHLGRALLPAIYLPALLLGGGRVAAYRQLTGDLQGALELFDRLELVYLSIGIALGLGIWLRALGRSRSVTTRRQLRWIIGGTMLGGTPFVLGYAVPFAMGWSPLPSMELTAVLLGLVPLAFASAIIRYRLMDVEVIIKRALVYTAAGSAIVAMYAVLLRLASVVFLGGSEQHNSVIALLATMVVVLLARPVKDAIQDTLDRAYYRDRYDYRRALVGFARDLSSDLELDRLSDRLVARVKETLLVDRIALMLAPLEDEDPSGSSFAVIRSDGFEAEPAIPGLPLESGLGRRVRAGAVVALDDPALAHRVAIAELDAWRGLGVYYFVPCVYKKTTRAVIALGRRDRLEPLNSEDLALLGAVSGQVATALENGRLYLRLRTKADELQRLREFSEHVIESLHDGLVVVDLDDRVMRWNQQVERIYGIPADEAVGKPLDELFDSAFLDAIRDAPAEGRAGGGVQRVGLTTRHESARSVLVNAATVPLRTPDGRAGTVLLLQDVTARVQLEEQLQISEKMASIGLLAAGVAHEVNTPLTGISSYTQMLLDSAERDSQQARLLEKIERQTFRASKIVNGLLHLARPATVERGIVDVNAVVGDVLSLLEHQLKTANVQVRRELAAPAPRVLGVEHKLQQVFLNLCINAKDAMRKGGWLTVQSRVEGEQVVIEVADTGAGIRREDLSRIYDPFFTTKEIGQGTGLGLAITYGIVQEHGGSIACHSTPGHGTRFVLTLPEASAAGGKEQTAT